MGAVTSRTDRDFHSESSWDPQTAVLSPADRKTDGCAEISGFGATGETSAFILTLGRFYRSNECSSKAGS